LKGELKTFCQSPNKTLKTTYMDNQLREFEELFLDNALFNLQNQALVNNNPKCKE
jgi:hypothetical protein